MKHEEKHAHVKEIHALGEQLKNKVNLVVGGENSLVGKIDDVVRGCQAHVDAGGPAPQEPTAASEPAAETPAAETPAHHGHHKK